MRIRAVLLCSLVPLLFAASFCQGDEDRIEVVGIGECADCERNSIDVKRAFSGIRVSIDCRTPKGHYKRRGVGELNEEGKFKVVLPPEILVDGKSKEECHAQLHSAAATPCPSYGGLESSKIVLRSITHGKHTYGLADKLVFSPVTCTSVLLGPYFKKPLPKFKKPLPPFPPIGLPPIYNKPFPPLGPTYQKPLPPQFPLYEKPLVPFPPKFKKPLPPPIPIFKKPLPPPVPIVKKPIPPSFPKFKKPLPPPVPIVKKPIPPSFPKVKKSLPHPILLPEMPFKKLTPQPFPLFKKPLPPPFPFFKPLPPFYKKPFPEIPPVLPPFASHP